MQSQIRLIDHLLHRMRRRYHRSEIRIVGGIIQDFLKRNKVFTQTTHMLLKYTGRGATDRKHAWAQRARQQAQGARFYSILARWDGDMRLRKPLLNNDRARQFVEMMQWERDRPQRLELRNAKERELSSGRYATRVQPSRRVYEFTADPIVWSTYKYALPVDKSTRQCPKARASCELSF